ncbi:zinc/manganese transport system substrate-binding protein [Dongia mobilis]|uniref:Zinc/manganese transport system substrate-binding protein n=1 Tax=Dongia mobilis TaxID=578943 RepID=A0A4R6WMS9_9PROT|nr:zinc ABC transporter substrate-binding protein [Dongia mobilis]TDQ80449.1 zinc/manganese transport system substrate-binding protein [Dongia mobilis]
MRLRQFITFLAFSAAGFCLQPVLATAQEPVRVVATFSILGDLVRQIGGDGVDLTVLVGPDQDAHGFDPGAADQRAVAGAELLIANGLGFESWLERLTDAAGFEGRIVTATAGIEPLAWTEAGDVHEHEHEHAHEGEDHDHDHDHDADRAPGAGPDHHDHGESDPHAFQDARLVLGYIDNIAAGLAEARPGLAAGFSARADALKAEFAAIDAELKAAFGELPAERRRVLTSHDAFAYFGRAYGLDFVSVQGASTEAEPSAQDMKKIVEQAKAGRVGAAFLENMTDPRLIETLAADTGIRIGGALYADALSGPDGPAPTLQSLFRYNQATLLEALR